MESKTFKVPNIGCNGCVQTIVNELRQQPGVQNVQGEVATKQVTVTWTQPASWEAIKQALVEIEYPAAEPA
ncbi:MAG: heavy-metal-associated domain-containing protein [bacterium]|nr:heavy-metal-associated domain-containing protein [bacterium]